MYIFYRASIWWKYLDGESVLPPPFTIFYLVQKSLQWAYTKVMELCLLKFSKFGSGSDVESPTIQKKRQQEEALIIAKSQFEKRYTHLMLMLINAPEKQKNL